MIWIKPTFDTEKLMTVLLSWRGTKYMRGQKCKGVGADCVRFIAGVMDDLYGYKYDEGLRMPYDTALHNHKGAMAVMRFFAERYNPEELNKVDSEYYVEPGDVIVTKVAENPGHVYIVGPQENTVWNSSEGIGVCMTGFGCVKNVIHVWRPRDKKLWLIS